MDPVILFLSFYLALYSVTVIALIYGFGKVPMYASTGSDPKTTFSIIIVFRNESDTLPKLLESIKNLNYPKELFEIILVDDFSDDDSQQKVYQWRMANGAFHTTLLENLAISGSPKKDGISRAVPIVINDWIVCTDADCEVNPEWLSTLNEFIQKTKVSMIAGGVRYQGRNTFLHHFQQMDMLSLQGATIGSFGLGKGFMCNGANIAYTKKLFVELGGFNGNNSIASGDDVFLLQKAVEKYPEKVIFLKSQAAIVTTSPVGSWKELIHQRVRWASKATSYQSGFGEFLALIVFLGNASLLVLLALAVCRVVPQYWPLYAFALKFIVDYILLLRTNSFLRRGKFIFPVLSSVLYPFFSVGVALYSFTGKYTWKGRKFR